MKLLTKPSSKYEPTEEDWEEFWNFCEKLCQEQERQREEEDRQTKIDLMLFEEACEELLAKGEIQIHNGHIH